MSGQIIPKAQVTTASAAREEMLAWAGGHLSHWNVICDVTSVEQRGEAIARAAEADAAEAAKWGAVASSLAISEAAEAIRIDVHVTLEAMRP